MELRIRIGERAAFFLLIGVALISAIGITMAAPPDPGHPWSEIDCQACITGSNIADNAVTAAKIADSAVTNAKLSGGITWSKITGAPAESDPTVADSVKDGVTWSELGTCSCGTCWDIKTYGSASSLCGSCQTTSAPPSCYGSCSGYVCTYMCTPGGWRLITKSSYDSCFGG